MSTTLKQITIDDIRSFKPCYDPTRYLPDDWRGTVIDILRVTDCPVEDRLWVVCREELIDARTLRLFAVWCARQALKLDEHPDSRSVNACDVAERYANELATDQELAAAMDAAMDAARDAARDAAKSAAKSAAWDAARAAAWDAAWDAQIDYLISLLDKS